MSLKVFHVVFITLAVIISLGFGLWTLLAYSDHNSTLVVVLGLLSIAIGGGLIVYAMRIVKKFREAELQ